jgi:hypothetical protein
MEGEIMALAHAEVPAVVTGFLPETKSRDLAAVLEFKKLDKGQLGKRLFSDAFSKYPHSETLMAINIANSQAVRHADLKSSVKSMNPNSHPAILGARFLRTSGHVQEVVNGFPGKSEAEIRRTAVNVFRLAERLTSVPPGKLNWITKQFNEDVTDAHGVMMDETRARRMALLAIAGKLEISTPHRSPKSRIGHEGPQDDTWRDLSSTFQDQLQGLSPPDKNKPAELPKSNVVYIAAKQREQANA